MISLNQGVMHSMLRSPLHEASTLSSTGRASKPSLLAPLLLTSLIDTFSILVIYLLANFSSSGEILYMSKGMELPKAIQGEAVERNTVIKIEANKIYLEEALVTAEQLTDRLLKVREKFQQLNPGIEFPGVITVQADRRSTYDALSPIVQAGGQAGFSDIRFAILPK